MKLQRRSLADAAVDAAALVAAQALEITDDEFGRVRDLAMRLAGISIPATKKTLIIGRWGRRLAFHSLTNFDDYLDLLSQAGGREELQIALDLLTTNETSFFREPKHFEFLRTEVLPHAPRGGQFRVWSAACSSGEEPYSVAMLLAAELPIGNWEVLGTDISARVLEAARTGLYGFDRAEQISPAYLRRFCLKGKGPQAGKFLIEKSLRERVTFARANLNEPLADFGKFDVILLRNVMIYFNTATKQRVMKHLLPALKPGGYFITGHCDTLAGVTHGLATRSASVYRKAAG
jgi:chemotaxis protein methyltransferase CheR